MMSGLGITQEAFQCTPDTLSMALDSGASAVIMLPWCNVPGVMGICVRAAKLAGKTLLTIVETNHGREAAIATARVLGSESGNQLVRVAVEHINAHGKDAATHAVEYKIHSDILSRETQNVSAPEPVTPHLAPSR
jgi:hypothetical protein